MKDFIKAMVEFLVKFIGIIIVIVGIAYVGASIERALDNEIYNNGECYYCGHGHYELINVQRSTFGSIHYFYKCNSCNAIIELNANMELQAL